MWRSAPNWKVSLLNNHSGLKYVKYKVSPSVSSQRSYSETDALPELQEQLILLNQFSLLSSENPRRLKHLSRLKIRECLGRLRLRAPVFISFLPLPASLKDYIRFKEYDIYSRGSFTEKE